VDREINSNPLKTTEAVEYTWRQYARRVGLFVSDSSGSGFERLGLKIQYGLPDESNILPEIGVYVAPCKAASWEALVTRAPESLRWLNARQVYPADIPTGLDNSVPVLFWGAGYEDGQKPFAEQLSNGSVVFYADIIAAAFFMLSRWEEMLPVERDQHQRFPAAASVAFRQGFLDHPIIDEYAIILREWIRQIKPDFNPPPGNFMLNLSHDIDEPFYYYPFFPNGLRVLYRDIIRAGKIKLALEDFGKILKGRLSDPYYSAIIELGETEQVLNPPSMFYFQSTRRSKYDDGYRLEAAIQSVLKNLQQAGFEIGLHPGYLSHGNAERLRQEKIILDSNLIRPCRSVRQHYLRFNPQQDWRIWEQAGFETDSTAGYAEYEGFRCGTCFPYHPFDIQEGRELDLIEIPLIVMDVTLRQYRQLEVEEARQIILRLAKRCQSVGGVFTLLWHNTSLYLDWQAWGKMYFDLLPELVQLRDQ
jgi:hypothetical protein